MMKRFYLSFATGILVVGIFVMVVSHLGRIGYGSMLSSLLPAWLVTIFGVLLGGRCRSVSRAYVSSLAITAAFLMGSAMIFLAGDMDRALAVRASLWISGLIFAHMGWGILTWAISRRNPRYASACGFAAASFSLAAIAFLWTIGLFLKR